MRKLCLGLLFSAVAAVLLAGPLLACSAVLFRNGDHYVAGRNYDWHLGHGMVMVNKRGMAKQALSFDNPAKWVSQYGSVTINQYGRELPCEGMNEKGLSIAMLWLDETKYPEADERPSLTIAQWVQYQLDTAATVDEVIESDNRVRITPFGGVKIHYFVADAEGNYAIVEFLEGKMVAHRRVDSEIPLITNSPYAESVEFLSQHEGFGGNSPTPASSSSLDRFVRLSTVCNEFECEEKPIHEAGFDALETVAKGKSTKWQVAYDLTSRRIYFRTVNHRAVREVDLTALDYENSSPILVLDIEARLKGDVTDKLRPYTKDDNRTLVDKSMVDARRVVNLPIAIRDIVINYPDFYCKPVAAAEVPSAGGK